MQLSRYREIAMRRHLRKPGVWIAALILLAIWLLWPRPVSSPPPTRLPAQTQDNVDRPRIALPLPAPAPAGAAVPAGALPAFLPGEARATIRLIQRGGDFPHPQDGAVFGNREGRLPSQPRGYYREYTVETPGLPHRGARRIITGGRPPVVWYYTDDHYASFRAFTVPAIERVQ